MPASGLDLTYLISFHSRLCRWGYIPRFAGEETEGQRSRSLPKGEGWGSDTTGLVLKCDWTHKRENFFR